MVYTPSEDIANLYVDATVIDRGTDSVLFTSVFQETSSSLSGDETFVFDDDIIGGPGMLRYPGKLFVIVVYTNDDDHGFVETIDLETGTLDSLEFDDQKGYDPTIIHGSDEIFIIAYRGYNDNGFLKTVEIDDTGNITDPVVDTLKFDDTKGYNPSIIHVSSKIYAIAYTGDGDHGFLKTVEIENDGQFNGMVDSFEFDSVKCLTPSLFHVDANRFGIVYRGDNDRGILKTVKMGASGNIISIEDTLVFDSVKCFDSDMIHVFGDFYAIAYGGDNDNGFLKTVEIDNNGDITDTVVDTLEFDPNKGMEPDIIHVSGEIYAIVYRGSGNFGVLTLLRPPWVATL